MPEIPKKVRTRFAPSPTGFVHIGSVRTALYSYLFARKNKGDFLLRIEDTDRTRLVEGSVEYLVKTFDILGLNADEGVILQNDGKVAQKGNFGPYIQSERLEIYQSYIKELLDKDYAYYCFCSQERLQQVREERQLQKLPPMYDGHCRNLSKTEIEKNLAEKIPFVIRMKIPKEGFTEFEDLVYGNIKIKNELIDDQVLMKSDGFPTYHFANVVDDHLMQISHIIRGEEWLPSTPKHILLYKYFNWETPQFAHLPLLLNPDKSKLSKRQGDVATGSFLDKGYLPEAILNFILLLGWNPKTEEEIFSIEEMIERFDLSGINKYGAVFNTEKLDWINGMYIRKMDLAKLTELCAPYLEKAGLIEKKADGRLENKLTKEIINFEKLKQIISLEQERMKKLSDIEESVRFMFVEIPEYEKELLAWKKMTAEEAQKNLEVIYVELEKIDEKDFAPEKLLNLINRLKEETGLSTGELLWPMRVSLSGLKNSPGPFEIATVLGKEKTLKRVKNAIEK
ncbi:MAG: glutamate--tRNA ligase [Candidatus Pacebacteria bacterium]|nr:glutamate--tRNA ligase [Candidatus Paceibacterota bacterium]